MTTNLRAYTSYFKIQIRTGLQYRTAALAGVCTQFFWGFMRIMVLEAFYAATSVPAEFPVREMVNYVWLQQAFLAIINLYSRDQALFDMITSGGIAYELTRPLNVYFFWFSKLVAKRLAGAALRFAPIIAVAMCLPEPYRFHLPPTWASLGLFVLSLAMTLLLTTAIMMFVYILTVITLSPQGSMAILLIMGEFFSGMVIPIALMPKVVQNILYCLPFHFTADFPMRVFSGNIPPSQAAMGIAVQMLWVVVLMVGGAFAMRGILRRAVVQGG